MNILQRRAVESLFASVFLLIAVVLAVFSVESAAASINQHSLYVGATQSYDSEVNDAQRVVVDHDASNGDGAVVGAESVPASQTVGPSRHVYDSSLDFVAPNTTTGFRAPATSVNRHGQLTNGSYTVDGVGNAAHQTGNLGSGSSQFLYRVDAAAYADDVGLWGQGVNVHPNQAVVYIENGPVGVLGRSGELTNWIKVTRTDTGFVHGWPASGP